MIVKIKRIDRALEIFQTEKFCLSERKDFHENLISVTVFSDSGKKISKRTNVCRLVKSFFVKKQIKLSENEEQTEL